MNWTPSGKYVFVSADGDDMGSQVAASILSGKDAEAKKLSLLINLGGKAIFNFAKRVWAAKSVISGGDDIMVKVVAKEFTPDDVEAMRGVYSHTVNGATLSVGVGNTPIEAMKALVVAKNTGKNKAIFWDKSQQSVYDKAVRTRINDLREKLRAQAGITESLDEIKRLAPAAVRRMNKARQRRPDKGEKASQRSAPSAPVKRRDLSPSVPSVVSSRQQHVNLMRDLLTHHKMKADRYKKLAAREQGAGNLKSSWEYRRQSKMAGKAKYADKAVLHNAAYLRDTKSLPSSMRKPVQAIRDHMAKTIKDARKRGVISGTKVVRKKTSAKPAASKTGLDPWAKSSTRSRARFKAHIQFASALAKVGRGHSLIPGLRIRYPSPVKSTEDGKPASGRAKGEVSYPGKKKAAGAFPKPPKKLPGGGYLVLKPRHLHAYLNSHHRPW